VGFAICLSGGQELTPFPFQIPLLEGLQPLLLRQPPGPDAGAEGEPAGRAGDRVQRLPGTGQRDHQLREAEAQLRPEPHHSESHPGSDARLEVGGIGWDHTAVRLKTVGWLQWSSND